MANKNQFTSTVGIARIATVVLGIVVMGVGLHSHFKSAWTGYTIVNRTIKPYEMCKLPHEGIKCPSISMERYYVAIIIICFILSLLGILASFMIDFSNKPYKFIDLGYHVIAAILLFIGAIVYFVSAEQIHSIYGTDKPFQGSNIRFQRAGKLAAASLTLLQSLLYGFIGFLIGRNGLN